MNMNRYYIRTLTYNTPNPDIIDEATIEQAERGENYLDPDDFMLLCYADSMEEAVKNYWKEVSQNWNEIEGESDHP